jgi:hypothetical protein
MAERRDPAELQAEADLQWVLGDRRGRRVLWRLIAAADVWGRIRAPNPDIHYREGRREIGIELMEWIDSADAAMIPLMMQESRNEDLRNDRRSNPRHHR